jgi:hypothetical protein
MCAPARCQERRNRDDGPPSRARAVVVAVRRGRPSAHLLAGDPGRDRQATSDWQRQRSFPRTTR